jgi:hypothetical protein
MTSTNVGGNNNNNNRAQRVDIDVRSELIDYTQAIRKLNLSVVQATRQVAAAATQFANPITRLQDSITRLDQSNRYALALGTTNEKLTKFVNKNTDVLSKGLVSNQKLIDAIASNFESGIRVQTPALMELSEEMIATGQDLQALTRMNSDLLLLTGDNIDALETVNRVNKEVSDKYGVSNEKLINSVNSLRDVFEESSFFGAKSTASLEAITMQLMGRTGGKASESAIRSLLKIVTGDFATLDPAIRLGAQQARAKLGAGQALNISDLTPILDNLAMMAEGFRSNDPLAIGAGLTARLSGLGGAGAVNELLNLRKQLQSNYELSEEMKKTDDDTFNNFQNINERARNFYDNTAKEMLGKLGEIDTNLVKSITDQTMAFGALLGLLPTSRAGSFMKVAGGVSRLAGAGAGLYGASMFDQGSVEQGVLGGASLGLAVLGPVGAVFGAAIGGLVNHFGGLEGIADQSKDLLAQVVDNTEKSAKADTETNQREKDKENLARAKESSMEIQRAQSIFGYLRSRNMIDYKENADILNYIAELLSTANIQRGSRVRTTEVK